MAMQDQNRRSDGWYTIDAAWLRHEVMDAWRTLIAPVVAVASAIKAASSPNGMPKGPFWEERDPPR